ncbi:MAG: endonuclease/exonuclease/phosphatase family protein [Planctomycetaceae bacterium]|nr:endonuclease/exonuclease/phosphatase family protein [Planctomycetaceae bacterium]
MNPALIRSWAAVLLLSVVAAAAGCDIEAGLKQLAQRKAGHQRSTASGSSGDTRTDWPTNGSRPPAAVPRPGDGITIASFNIQVFGTSKAEKPEVMRVLADVVRRFDVVAIQEIRAKDQNLIPQFVQQINAAGGHYDFVLGSRQGRTSSKEQYAYLYDASRIEVRAGSVYSVPDPQDLLHRPPLVAGFIVRGPPASEAFSFTLINIHTDPDEVEYEVDALADVYEAVRQNGDREDDIILLGDLNASPQQLGRLGRLPGLRPAIYGVPTNTRRNKEYDNILLDSRATTEFTGEAGVLDLEQVYRLTREQALDVSDHLPVWATFRPYEAGTGPIAAGPRSPRRQ